MRLTLRTLLSYLDDMLEPGQAKAIGAKVAESEQARELTERIKQVTRRRRLTTPPTSGPGGIDANTIAEYLDNDVTPEKAAEVEQICLASDVHLAEVAACHQILTIVLGEPALVPPASKQRMYALVKGPESIPFRKPAKSATKEYDQDLSSEIDPEHDETLRMGVPPADKSNRNLWLLVGGGGVAASLLVLVIWQFVSDINAPNRNTDLVAKDGKDKDRTDGAPKDGKDKTDSGAKDEKDKVQQDAGAKDKDKGKDVKTDGVKTDKDDDGKDLGIKVVPVEINKTPAEVPYTKPSAKQQLVALYMPAPKDPGVLLQGKADKGPWTRVLPNIGKKVDLNVTSARALLSLPGSKNLVILETGVEVTLWGNLFETTLDPFHAESRAIIHENAQLDADVTLQRGRLVVRNLKTKEATVRIRFDNTTLGEEGHFDMVLDAGNNTTKPGFVIELRADLDPGEPFFENPKDAMRKGPTTYINIYAQAGSTNIRSGSVSYRIDETSRQMVEWTSKQMILSPSRAPGLPIWFKGTPPLKSEGDQAARKKAIAAHDDLAKKLETQAVDVALAELIQHVQQTAQKESAGPMKQMSPDTFALWRHAIRCYAATDDVSYVFEEFANEKTHPMIRGLCQQTLGAWLGQSRENDYELLEIIRKAGYKKTASIKVVELFHKFSDDDARKPITYQHLIEGLNNDLMPIRALSHWHLFVLAPAGRDIRYDPAMSAPNRAAAQKEWYKRIPPGQLPPAPKEKG